MTTSVLAPLRHPTRLHRPLAVFTGLMLVSTVVSLLGLAVDDRMLVGVPIWLKPLKFSISLAIYSLTIAWLLALPRPAGRGARLGWWMGTVIVAAGAIEMIVIIGQTIRGRPSHFDVATPLDAALWSVMGTTIAILWLATLVIAAGVARLRIGDRAETSAVRGGLVVALVGIALGFLMTSPTAAAAGHAERRRDGRRDRRAHRRAGRRRARDAADRLEHRGRRPADPAFRRDARAAGAADRRAAARPAGRAGWAAGSPTSRSGSGWSGRPLRGTPPWSRSSPGRRCAASRWCSRTC